MRMFAEFTIILLLATPAVAGTCGSSEVRDVVENESMDRLTRLKAEVEGPNETTDALGNRERLLFTKDFKAALSETYEIGSEGAVKHCHGKMTMSIPSGASGWQEFRYDVIETDDGKIIVRQEIFGNLMAIERAEQILLATMGTGDTPPKQGDSR